MGQSGAIAALIDYEKGAGNAEIVGLQMQEVEMPAPPQNDGVVVVAGRVVPRRTNFARDSKSAEASLNHTNL
ncbi:hypothetical protein BAE42_10345 [Mesorhizobium loti]|nr:hypothetical protein BAE42_10345 [Mesorhizobium loti]